MNAETYTLTGSAGGVVEITNVGASIKKVLVPDSVGVVEDVVLGFDNAADYLKNDPSFGCATGRVANRISGASFDIDGTTFELEANHGPNNLHSGPDGISGAVWDVSEVSDNSISLSYLSPDGQSGFPGNLDIKIDYKFTEANELQIDYKATTDAPTPINLTNHTYFNLAGSGNVLEHLLHINSPSYTPVDSVQIPTGELAGVAGTPFDFTGMTAIGERIAVDDDQLEICTGYDHNYVLSGNADELAVEVIEPVSGRCLQMTTTEPGVQFYTGNFLGGQAGKAGITHNANDGFCLEAQRFPNAVNQPKFDSPILRPGETYTQTTTYRFSVL